MSNFKDQRTGISRFLDSKDENKDKDNKLDTESRLKTPSSHIIPQEKKPLFTSEQRKPAHTGVASSPLRPNTPITQATQMEQEQRSARFTRQNTEERTTEQKINGLITPPSRISPPPASPANNLFVKPSPAGLTTPNSTLNTAAANTGLSFKEKMEALQKKQTEARALINAQRTELATNTKTPFGNKAAVTAIFGEKKQAPLFTATRTQSDSPAVEHSNPIVSTQTKSDYKISTEEFTQLRDFLYEQSGIFVNENRKYLMENRLSSRLRELGLRNFNEYHNYLRFDNNRMTELNKLFENMTTNETSFFRNNPQLDIFRDKVLTKVLNEQKEKGQKNIHIWSAGCSSGEEPYTIGIILHELLGNEIDRWNIKITANDLSPAMLETAQKGLYSEYSLRTTPQEMIDKYFTKEGKMFKILPKVQKLVTFGQINLASTPQLSKVERSHIVFCRNVIIYFDDEMKRHVINAFYDNLLPGGFLLIGHSESLHSISKTFVPEHFAGAIVYGKKS